jgi:multiple antibiotic resistance protein
LEDHSVDQDLLLFTSLFALFNPPAAIAPFVAVTGAFPRDVQHRMAKRIGCYYALAMVGAALVGHPLLALLGISLPALRLTGGFILLLAAIPMATHPERYVRAEVHEALREEESSWTTLSAVPLTFPISLGGATLSAIVTAGSAASFPWGLGRVIAVCVAMALVVWLTFRFAPLLGRRLSRGGLSILTAVGGVLLLCIAFQVLVPAVRALVAG